MTHPILVAVSEGDEAQAAIDLGVMAARLLDAPLILVGVVVTITPGGATVVPGWTPVSNRTMLRDHVERKLQDRADAVPVDVSCTTRVTQALAALHGLELLADDEGAQLLVVGASHLGPLARATRGDIGAGAIRHAGCALLIAPDDPAHAVDRAPARIVVGWDGSAEADEALELAGTLAARAGATVEILRAVEDGEAGHAKTQVGAAVERLGEVAPCSGAVRSGPPAEALVEASASCDLLVVGARHLSVLQALTATRVSRAVLHRARCPVLVAPHGARVPARA